MSGLHAKCDTMFIEKATILTFTGIATVGWLLFFLSTGIVLLYSPTPLFAENAGIKLLSWFCAEEGSHIAVKGEIRNQSTNTQTPAVIAKFESIDGVVITLRRKEYALDPLPAGQTASIELRTRNQREIASCELILQDPASGNIYASVKHDLPYELRDGLGDAKRGKDLFNGKGACDACHGYLGQVDEIRDSAVGQAAEMNPKWPNLRNPQSLKLTTDKQRFRAIKYGLPGTVMLPMPHISNDEIIDMLAYLRNLRQESIAEPPVK